MVNPSIFRLSSASAGNLYKSPFPFHRRGESGLWVSDLLPNLAKCADKLTVIKSMVAKSANHMPAIAQMNSGFVLTGFPAMGAWVSYGLGSENQDLPAYVVLPDPRSLPWGGSLNWSSAFLPASHQGTAFRTSGEAVPDLATPEGVSASSRRAGLDWVSKINSKYQREHPGDTALEARLRSYEIAARMQLSVPEITDLRRESEATRQLYGVEDKQTEALAKNCPARPPPYSNKACASSRSFTAAPPMIGTHTGILWAITAIWPPSTTGRWRRYSPISTPGECSTTPL